MLILFIIFFIFFAYLSCFKINWALAFICAFLPSYLIRFDFLGIPFTFLEMMILVLFSVWFIKHFKELKYIKLDQWFFIAFAWLIIGVIALFVTHETRAALGIYKAYFLEPFLFFLVLVNTVKEKKDFNLIFFALGFSAFYLSLFAIYQKFTGEAIINPLWKAEETRRVTSFFLYPNALGLYLAPLVIIFFNKLINESKKYYLKLIDLLIIFLSLLSIIFARSAGALAGILTGIIFIGLFTKKIRWITIVLSVILLSLVLLSPFKNEVIEEITLKNDSGTVRREMWVETIKMLKDHPFFGAGLANYQNVFTPYHKAKHIEIYLYPHNIFLNFYSELGLLGLIVFLWLMIYFFFVFFKKLKDSFFLVLLLGSVMVTILVHGLVDVPYLKNDLSVFFWMIIGMMAIIWRGGRADEGAALEKP